MTVKFDSIFIKLGVCVKKSNFLSWAIRPFFADPVTINCAIKEVNNQEEGKIKNFKLD